MNIDKLADKVVSVERWNRIAGNVARKAGEDWMVTPEIEKLTKEVFTEIRRRGGMSHVKGTNHVSVSNLPVDPTHGVPLEIDLYEGTYYPNKVIVNATFSGRHPLPIRDRQPYNARAVVDAIVEAFMFLVNYKEAGESSEVRVARNLTAKMVFGEEREKASSDINISHELAILAQMLNTEPEEDEMLSVEAVAKICPACAKKMQAKGLKGIRASVLKASLKKQSSD